jgi:hypothetical protein
LEILVYLFKTGTMEDVETMIILLIAIYYCLRLGRLACQLRFLNCAMSKSRQYSCESVYYISVNYRLQTKGSISTQIISFHWQI